MITLSSRVSNLLNSGIFATFNMVKIDGVLTVCDYPHDLVFNGETYSSSGTLISVSQPKLSSSVDRSLYTMSFVYESMTAAQFLAGHLTGRKTTTYLGFVEDGAPLLDPEDVVIVNKGVVDSISLNINGSSFGSRGFTVSCASPMGALDMKKSPKTSKDYLRSLSPSDTAFDEIYVGAARVIQRWGKG